MKKSNITEVKHQKKKYMKNKNLGTLIKLKRKKKKEKINKKWQPIYRKLHEQHKANNY